MTITIVSNKTFSTLILLYVLPKCISYFEGYVFKHIHIRYIFDYFEIIKNFTDVKGKQLSINGLSLSEERGRRPRRGLIVK